jgi:AcrR family transcriptional regulator
MARSTTTGTSTRNTKTSSRTENPSARDRILAAAQTLFAEHGFEPTSTARIAAEAEVPHGLIFYYFPTKMDLLLALVRDEHLLSADEILPRIDDHTDLAEAVRALWQRLCDTIGRPSPGLRIMLRELDAHPEIRQIALQRHERLTQLVTEYLARASGQANNPQPRHEAAARLITIAAGMTPLLRPAGSQLIHPDAVAALLTHGLVPEAPSAAPADPAP